MGKGNGAFVGAGSSPSQIPTNNLPKPALISSLNSRLMEINAGVGRVFNGDL
ncbi:hypothetical protein PL11201_270043 [Planktothrix sp. PCC 11201]|nr:hypothetical protein PL11201_270043 [Planktothrix sp. PCC 11201]